MGTERESDCPGQGRYLILDYFYPKHGQGFKTPAATLHPNMDQVFPPGLVPQSEQIPLSVYFELCGSRKFPYLPHGSFFLVEPSLPPGIYSLA